MLKDSTPKEAKRARPLIDAYAKNTWLDSTHIRGFLLQKSINGNMLTAQLPFPTPVNTNTIGQIPDGSPNVAISSATAMTAALAAASEGYI
jgi:hypothetical protein